MCDSSRGACGVYNEQLKISLNMIFIPCNKYMYSSDNKWNILSGYLGVQF